MSNPQAGALSYTNPILTQTSMSMSTSSSLANAGSSITPITMNPLIHSCLPSALGAQPTPDSGLRVEPKGLYILLWFTGYNAKYHWALLAAQTATTGIIFHQTTATTTLTALTAPRSSSSNNASQSDPRDLWQFVVEDENVAESPGLLCALKVGVLDDVSDEWIAAVKECVCPAEVQAGEEFSCRTWALAALFELANGGFIGMIPDRRRIGDIEMEARLLARDTEILGTRMVTQSEMF